MNRSTLVLVALILFSTLACGPSSENVDGSTDATARQTEILWDEWGVPHIYANDLEGLFYAQGWAQARNHGDLVLRLYGESRGRAAEYWGEDRKSFFGQPALESDRWVHTMGIPERAAVWYAEQRPEMQTALDAFAAGFNEYANAHLDLISDDVEMVLPVLGTDVLGQTQRSVHFTFLVSPADVGQAAATFNAGSNAWAIGPSRSESGRAMLVANPHLPWHDLFTWMEMHLVTPELDISGATLVGMPFISIGFNDHLAWTHTVNTHDGADIFELTLEGEGYRFDGETRAFDVATKTVEVLQADGSTRDEVIEVRSSVHGPVVAEADGKALALRVVGLDRSQLLDQYLAMAAATNLEEFEAAERLLQMPMFTTMYADRDGRIMHLFGGLTPRRGSGDWQYWDGVVPGDISETLWTETHAYDELPRVVDPASGWLQNANDPPWTTTYPPAIDPDGFPSYMAPRFMHFRAQQSAKLLLDDESLSFEELVAAKLSTSMLFAERVLDDLEKAVVDHRSQRAQAAWAVLATWDRSADADSRGAVLFAAFAQELRASGSGYAEKWDESRPLETPDGFADPTAAVAALERAAEAVENDHGALDVPWGDVFRVRRGNHDLPANGGPGSLGIFRVLGSRPAEDGKQVGFAGDTYVAIVEFSDPVRAATLLSYGNASQPGSPHDGDQLELFSRKEMRTAWRSREEIEAHLEEREVLPR